jgi:hypothetical protein
MSDGSDWIPFSSIHVFKHIVHSDFESGQDFWIRQQVLTRVDVGEISLVYTDCLLGWIRYPDGTYTGGLPPRPKGRTSVLKISPSMSSHFSPTGTSIAMNSSKLMRFVLVAGMSRF